MISCSFAICHLYTTTLIRIPKSNLAVQISYIYLAHQITLHTLLVVYADIKHSKVTVNNGGDGIPIYSAQMS